MIELKDIAAQLDRAWNGGSILHDWLTGTERWPLRVPLRTPSGTALLRNYDQMQTWIAQLEQSCRESGCVRLEYEDVRVQKLGAQRLPQSAWVDSREHALALIRKTEAFQAFRDLVAQTRSRQPRLGDWLTRRPLRALDHAAAWLRLLDLCDWFLAHPKSGLYARQIDVHRVDTKFIEANLGILTELLQELMPESGVPTDGPVASPMRRFAQRFGLASEEPMIRFRLLDEALVRRYQGASDLTVPLSQFETLAPPCSAVFITENKVNGLAFPDVPSAVVVFGLGYGIDSLRGVGWLDGKRLIYWGDIDTHGYHILSRLRARWPQVESMLMHASALTRWAALATVEPEQARDLSEPAHLTPAESEAFQQLRDGRFAGVRIEQERIPFHAIVEAVRTTLSLDQNQSFRAEPS